MKVERKVNVAITSDSGHMLVFSNAEPPQIWLDVKDALSGQPRRLIIRPDGLAELRDLIQAGINEIASSTGPVAIVRETTGPDPKNQGTADADCG